MNTLDTIASRLKHVPLGSNIFQTFLGVLTQIADRIQRMRKARVTYKALRDLDDHILRDVGLTRADIVDLQNFGRAR